jgi:HK97 family phage prohead protease
MEDTLHENTNRGDFNILKSNDDLMIGGYASIEIVDKQNDLITIKALNEAVKKFMEQKSFRNVMTNHSNVQVGEVVDSYRDKTGRLFKTEVDDVGFFVVIKLRDDIEKAKEINRGIRKGSLRSFSIGGQALQKVKKSNPELGQYNEISKLELHEVTICEKGINPEAKFDILKQEKTGEEEMTEKLEKALEELDTLLKEVNTLRKEEEEMMDEKESMYGEEKAMMDEKGMHEKGMHDEKMEDEESMEYMDMEEKAYVPTLDGAGNEIGEPADRIIIEGGKPKPSDLPVVKAFNNEELNTLDLSVGNIEKAYEAFRQEQLEKLAYDNLQKSFAARFEQEVASRENILAKQNYDAASEISALKEEFTELRKSLTAEREVIAKAQEEAAANVPTLDDIAKMDWSDVHRLVGGNL